MEEATCERTEYLNSYLPNVDDILLIPGTLGRIRPKANSNVQCKLTLKHLSCNFLYLVTSKNNGSRRREGESTSHLRKVLILWGSSYVVLVGETLIYCCSSGLKVPTLVDR